MTITFSCLQFFTKKTELLISSRPILLYGKRKLCTQNMNSSREDIMERMRKIVPSFENGKHKGQAGRIGVIGGSLEYTGAPYFAGITALKVGADLVHVFCQRDAAQVIKSYSPELIVHPILDTNNAIHEILQWSDRLHALVIGPGLGRDANVLQTVAHLIELFQKQNKPIVIDADGLHILTVNRKVLNPSHTTVLTPNAVEFTRLMADKAGNELDPFELGVTILKKGENDAIYDAKNSEIIYCPPGGSGRRCGGQGDLLSGALAIFLHWAVEAKDLNPPIVAAFAACYLTKLCNSEAFKKHGRSTLASDMISELHHVFDEHFETR